MQNQDQVARHDLKQPTLSGNRNLEFFSTESTASMPVLPPEKSKVKFCLVGGSHSEHNELMEVFFDGQCLGGY